MTAIFVPAVGQYDNIGDIILRRPLLDMLRPHGRLHIYLGPAPAGYVRGLQLESGDVTYVSFGRWYRALLRSAGRGRTHYAFKPGEIQLTVKGMKEHIGMLPALLLLRLRGGRIVRVGSGARALARMGRALMQPALAITHFTAWRDADTAAYLGHGGTMPDFGFTHEPSPARSPVPSMLVSMRGDRPMPGRAWLEGIRVFADSRGLRLTVVTQVARDEARTRELAEALGAEMLGWDGTNHDAQEARLRAAYASAAIIASDRLHVLIAGATEGATPIAPLPAAAPKIDRHFTTAGLPSISVLTEKLDPMQISDALDSVVVAIGDPAPLLLKARQRLVEIGREVSNTLGGGR